ncbi:hypothetical protein ACLI4Z_16170 [Natrialbaceae archaeon A-arb3/5]
MDLTRRRLLSTATGTALATVLAGCTNGSDDGPDDDADSDSTADDGEASDDEEGTANGSDDEGETTDDSDGGEPTEYSLELLAEENIDHEHACLHAEFDDRTSLEAGATADEAPTVEETHVIWEVTYEGDGGYVSFDADAHDYEGALVFYTAEGSADPVTGTVLEDGDVEDDACDPLDEYIEVEPDDGFITLEL